MSMVRIPVQVIKRQDGLYVIEWTRNIYLHRSGFIKFDVTCKCPEVQDLAACSSFVVTSMSLECWVSVAVLNGYKCSKVTVSIGKAAKMLTDHHLVSEGEA